MALAKAPVKPKALKKLNLPVAPDTDAESGVDKNAVIPLTIEGEAVAAYNDAAGQVKAWEKEKEVKRPLVAKAGLTELYRHNCAAPTNAAKSVRVVDSTGAACVVTLADTYGKAKMDPKALTAQLARMGHNDINLFVAEKLQLSFDQSVFYGENGELLEDAYIDFMEVTAAFANRNGIKNPFSSTTVVSPIESFATARWTKFKADQQFAVSELFPATVSLKPVVEVKKPE